MDLQVDPGRTLTVTVVDPEGKPVGGTMAIGLTDLFSSIEYRAGIADDRDPRPRSVEAPARDHHPRRAEARRLRLPQGGRDRP